MLRALRLRSVLVPSYAYYTSINAVRCFQTAPKTLGFFGAPQEESLMKRVAKRFGWTETSRSVLIASGYLLYIKAADTVDFMNFFKHCDMEDTFVSWFNVMELHIWLVAVRLMEEGEEGKVVRNAMVKAMWEDCDTKSKQLEGALSSARKSQIQTLSEEFQACLVSYDEGLMGNDKVLAGALWRRFLRKGDSQTTTDQEELLKQVVALEMLVLYVRSQYYNLNKLSKEQLLKRRFKFAPFDQKLFDLADKLTAKRAVL